MKRNPAIPQIVANALKMGLDDSILFLAGWRWPNGPRCPECGSEALYRLHVRPKVFRCQECKTDFTPLSGTALAYGKAPVQVYVAAIKALEAGGVNSLQFGELAGIQQRSAWKILGCLRGMARERL